MKLTSCPPFMMLLHQAAAGRRACRLKPETMAKKIPINGFKGGYHMKPDTRTKAKYILVGMLAAFCFFIVSGFRLPTPPASDGSFQFFKEKESTGIWVFETDTGTSKFFDVENGIVIVNSFQMDSITVKSKAKTSESKTP